MGLEKSCEVYFVRKLKGQQNFDFIVSIKNLKGDNIMDNNYVEKLELAVQDLIKGLREINRGMDISYKTIQRCRQINTLIGIANPENPNLF